MSDSAATTQPGSWASFSSWTPDDARAFLGEWRENGNASKARAHLAAALDENERLREALERIMLWTPNPPGITGDIALCWIRDAAREALND